MYNPGEINKEFCLESCSSGPHLPFYESNAITRAGFILWHRARTLRSDGKSFYDLYLYLAGRCCKNVLCTRGPVQCKSVITWLISKNLLCTRGPVQCKSVITWLISVTILYTIFKNNLSSFRQFLVTKYF